MRRNKTFSGGIYPPDAKLTAGQEIKNIEPPDEVVIPLSQHIGAPAEPIVEEGDEVLEGEKIGEARGFVSSPVHSSVAGTVKEIGEFPHPSGYEKSGIRIEVDPSGGSIDFSGSPPFELTPDEILERVQHAGIVGMGGAAFPTHVKLSPPEDKEVDTLIINGAECEPYLTADYRLMMEKPEEIVKGTRVIARALGVEKVLFGIEDNKAAAAKEVQRAAGEDIEVVTLPTKYPQGWEKTLIYALTEREVPVGGLPLDVGVVVQNVGTAGAIWQALRYGRPLTERVVTLTGSVANRGNYMIKVGTKWEDVFAQLGGPEDRGSTKLIDGGPMMGNTQSDLGVPVLKSTSGILLLDDIAAVKRDPIACIGCGKCIDACPANLLPTAIYKSMKTGDLDRARELNATACCECGSCAYVCPSEIPLTQWIVQAKNEIALEDREEDG